MVPLAAVILSLLAYSIHPIWSQCTRHDFQTCRDPPAIETMEKDLHLGDTSLHESIFMVPPIIRSHPTKGDVRNGCLRVTHTFLWGNRTCPQGGNTDTSGEQGLESRALCSWYYEVNHDPGRIPSTITEAACRCEPCYETDQKKHTGKTCTKMYYHIRVLRRVGCHNGIWKYRSVFEPVSVGCVCASREEMESVQGK